VHSVLQEVLLQVRLLWASHVGLLVRTSAGSSDVGLVSEEQIVAPCMCSRTFACWQGCSSEARTVFARLPCPLLPCSLVGASFPTEQRHPDPLDCIPMHIRRKPGRGTSPPCHAMLAEEVVAWSAACLASGTRPSSRHDNVPFSESGKHGDAWRAAEAGTDLGIKACIVEVRGGSSQLKSLAGDEGEHHLGCTRRGSHAEAGFDQSGLPACQVPGVRELCC
jgi:hypothetical protein